MCFVIIEDDIRLDQPTIDVEDDLDDGDEDEEPTDDVREFFPETWIWELMKTE